MSIRDTINKNQSAVIIVAAVLIVAAGAFIWFRNNPPGGGGGSVYYADIVTGEIFAAPVSRGSPTQSPEGNEAYRADVYTCGECKDGDWFVAGYIRDTGEGLTEVSVDGKTWGTTMGGKYIEHMNKVTTCPGDMSAAPCYPP